MNQTPPSALDLSDEGREILTKTSLQYDPAGAVPERSFDRIAAMFNAASGRTGKEALDGRDIAEIMCCVKSVRRYSAPGFHRDSFVDGANYVLLAGELAARDAAKQ